MFGASPLGVPVNAARIGELGSPSGVARLGGENPRKEAIVHGEHLIFRRFHDEQFLHLPQLVGHLGCEIVGLRVVLGDVIQFPFVAVDHVRHLGPAANHGGSGGVVEAIQPSW